MSCKCYIPGCTRTTNNQKKRHCLPKDPETRRKWCQIINRLDLVNATRAQRSNVRICDIHFAEDAKFIAHRNRTNLKFNAVPTLHLGDNKTKDQIYKSYVVCDQHFSSHDRVPGTKRGLRKTAFPTTCLPHRLKSEMATAKSAGSVCAARTCKSRSYVSPELSFFTFPKDIARARIWIIACQREDLLEKIGTLHTNYKLCELHFESKMIIPNDLRKRLRSNAVPTRFSQFEGGSGTSSVFDHTYTPFAVPPLEPLQKVRALQSIVIRPSVQNVAPDDEKSPDFEMQIEEFKIEIVENPLEPASSDQPAVKGSETSRVNLKRPLILRKPATYTETSQAKKVSATQVSTNSKAERSQPNASAINDWEKKIRSFHVGNNGDGCTSKDNTNKGPEDKQKPLGNSGDGILATVHSIKGPENQQKQLGNSGDGILATVLQKQKSGAKCAYSTCFNIKTNDSFFVKFPQDYKRAVPWIMICNRADILLKSPEEVLKFVIDSPGVCFQHYRDISLGLGNKVDVSSNNQKSIESGTTQNPVTVKPNSENSMVQNDPLEQPIITIDSDEDTEQARVNEKQKSAESEEIIYVPSREYCAFINCATHIRKMSVRKYRFPKSPNLVELWRRAAGIPEVIKKEILEPLFVCEKHFTEAHKKKIGVPLVPTPHETFIDRKAVAANPHWLRKQKQTRKKYTPEPGEVKITKPTAVVYTDLVNDKRKLPPATTPSRPIIINSYICPSNTPIVAPGPPIPLIPKEKCCVKHCQSNDISSTLFGFPDTYRILYELWIKAVENKAIVPESKTFEYKTKKICKEHFEAKYLEGGYLLRPEAIPTLNLIDEQEKKTKEEWDTDIVWRDCSDTEQEGKETGYTKGTIVLGDSTIKFENLNQELKFGKGCARRGLNKFPYSIYPLPYEYNGLKRENIRVGRKFQVHTAIIVDDDDESESLAVKMVCALLKKNQSIPKKRSAVKKLKRS